MLDMELHFSLLFSLHFWFSTRTFTPPSTPLFPFSCPKGGLVAPTPIKRCEEGGEREQVGSARYVSHLPASPPDALHPRVPGPEARSGRESERPLPQPCSRTPSSPGSSRSCAPPPAAHKQSSEHTPALPSAGHSCAPWWPVVPTLAGPPIWTAMQLSVSQQPDAGAARALQSPSVRGPASVQSPQSPSARG